MLASRLIERSRRQRRLIARLVTRHALLRRTAIGARMLRVLADAEYDLIEPSATAWPNELGEDRAYEWADLAVLADPATDAADLTELSESVELFESEAQALAEPAHPQTLVERPEPAAQAVPDPVVAQATAHTVAPAPRAPLNVALAPPRRLDRPAVDQSAPPNPARAAQPLIPDQDAPMQASDQRTARLDASTDARLMPTAAQSEMTTAAAGALPAALGADATEYAAEPFAPDIAQVPALSVSVPALGTAPAASDSAPVEPAQRSGLAPAGQLPLAAATPTSSPHAARRQRQAEPAPANVPGTSAPADSPTAAFDTVSDRGIFEPSEFASLSVTRPDLELPAQAESMSLEPAPLSAARPGLELPAQVESRPPEPAPLGVARPDLGLPAQAESMSLEPAPLGAARPDLDLPAQVESPPLEPASLGAARPDLGLPAQVESPPLEPASLSAARPDLGLPAQVESPPLEPASLSAARPDLGLLAQAVSPPLEPAPLGAAQADLESSAQAESSQLDSPVSSEPIAEQSLQAAPPDMPKATGPQPRRSRRAQFEEIGTRSMPLRAAGPVAPTPAKPSPASEIFNRTQPERDIMDWGRLLFDSSSQPAQSETPAVLPPADQPPSAPPAPPAAGPSMRQAATAPSRRAQAIQQPAAAEAQPEQPIRLAEATRKFLRPLVGVDPESVRIYRGALAERITSDQAADAATAGDAILLGAGNQDEAAPQTLGLLAHELVHVARQRTPRFVPPIVRGRVAETADEEVLAQAVESQARSAARASDPAQRAPYSLGALPPAAPEGGPSIEQPAGQPADPAQDPAVWSGLPAPWQPLPGWVTSAWAESAGADQPMTRGSTPSSAGESAAGSMAAGAASPAFQLAEHDRSIESSAPVAAPASAAAAAAPVPMDMDALAKQVYAVLKQRLAAERRRLG